MKNIKKNKAQQLLQLVEMQYKPSETELTDYKQLTELPHNVGINNFEYDDYKEFYDLMSAKYEQVNHVHREPRIFFKLKRFCVIGVEHEPALDMVSVSYTVTIAADSIDDLKNKITIN